MPAPFSSCLVEACAPLLAAEGPAMVEALVWLYR